MFSKFFKKTKSGAAINKWMTATIKDSFDHDNFNQKNIFNKISHKSKYGFYFWPYGYLFRYCKWGDINELGFREINNFYEIEKKYENYYKIGFFGGSTGFDILVKDEDSIVRKLENKLNSDSNLVKKYGSFKVINFSQPGNLVFSQILNYVQFSVLINLKLIISHNPSNDFGTSPMNDPKLIKNYKLAYVDMMEAFAEKIHEPENVNIEVNFCDSNDIKNFKPASIKTDVDTIIKSYLTRLYQFKKLVEDSNKLFVSGYQPFIFSKKNLSKFEKEKLETYNIYYKKVYDIIPKIYERFEESYESKVAKEINFINLHKKFFNITSEVSHFGDTVHLLEPGNELVAEEYFKHIKNLLN